MPKPAEQEIVLRRAVVTEAEQLYRWRTDPVTRTVSGNTATIEFDGRHAWLASSLADPNRQIFIAEYRGQPVGTVRADKVDSGWQLSWTVAPESRGRCFGSGMVRLLAASIRGSVEAVIKPRNAASIRIAEAAGMRFDKEEDGVLRFFRGPL